MSLYDWLLFLHLLAAFLLVAGLVAFAVMVLGPSEAVVSRTLAPAATALWNAGGLGVIVFGVWLALEVDGYELWDGWILASFVFWAIAVGVGSRGGKYFQRAAMEPGSAVALRRTGLMLQLTASAALLLLIVMMVFKPGA